MPDISLVDEIRAASRAGFSALDLWAPKLDAYLATYPVVWLDIEMRKHHVYAASVSGIELSPPDSREDRLVYEAHFLELCTHVDALGGGPIVMWPGTGSDEEQNNVQVVPWLVHTLRRYSDLAAPFEVRVAFEFAAHASSSVRTLAASQEIVRQVRRSNVGLAFSIGQLSAGGGGPESIETLDVGKLWLVRLESAPPSLSQVRPEAGREASLSPPAHTGESRNGSPLQTALQHAVCKQLAAKGFRGPYCVECPTPAPADQPDVGQDSFIECARRARQVALEILESLYP
jgi:hypothetical protein